MSTPAFVLLVGKKNNSPKPFRLDATYQCHRGLGINCPLSFGERQMNTGT